jgi:formyl-CoA transferase
MSSPVDHPVLGQLHLVSSPLNFDGVRRCIRSATPDGGADADRILHDLGYSDEKINTLRATGIC